ncbi:nucleotide sugar dehydrogenase [Alkalibacillus haloalkaliphilus]|uniref:nucleotide sugar dehydrogenase n=1 Tax=Alkalibacillus haloalkaliphilus TaxID=94136 RepID=UPI00030E9977
MFKEKVAVIGLGYVGLPLAIELARKYDVVGFDINESKINDYKRGSDVTGEVGEGALRQTSMTFTNEESLLSDCQFYIVSVPTPINTDKTPDLNPVIAASRTVGKHMGEGSIVVYESTVYPGTTEEICVPILEEESGLKLNGGFKVGYSPERINPGDQQNTITNIVKIASGSDDEALDRVAKLYGSVIDAGVHRAESIKVAEAAKVIENAQRDINIAFMNELSMVFNRMNIPTKAVLEAAGTKWNFLKFTPGLVGGHCIGVDPYYFTYKAEQLGYHSQIVLAGRKINDAMGKHVASNTIKKMVQAKQDLSRARVAILGLAFKENVQDVRNSKVVDIVKELHDYDIDVLVHDPLVRNEEVESEYGLKMSREEELDDLDAIIVAVGHDEIKQRFTHERLHTLYKNKNNKVLIDVKEIYDRNECEREGYYYWSL